MGAVWGLVEIEVEFVGLVNVAARDGAPSQTEREFARLVTNLFKDSWTGQLLPQGEFASRFGKRLSARFLLLGVARST